MARPSVREARRRQIAAALIKVLGTHGTAAASIANIAAQAGLAPGLVHHYFADKQDLYAAALESLHAGFRARIHARADVDASDPVMAYVDAALTLDGTADVVAARAWVGLFAAAIADPALFEKVRRMLASEVAGLQRRSGHALATTDASAILAFVVGALVFGAFAPRSAAGFAAPAVRRFVGAVRSGRTR